MTSIHIKTIDGKSRYLYHQSWNPHLGKRVWKYVGKAGHLPSTTFRLETCDFRALKVRANSVDLVLTDPPYGDEALGLWRPLAKFAARALRPSGILVTYCGHRALPSVLHDLQTELDFVWQVAVIHQGAYMRVHSAKAMVGWRPVLIFTKPPFHRDRYFKDVLLYRRREKNNHEWQQNLEEAREFIRSFTEPGDIVLDPMVGSGTVAIAARGLSRSFIGCDKDPAAVQTCRDRIANELGLAPERST